MATNKYKAGNFYRDLVNGDLLKILAFSDEAIYDDRPEELVRYVKCAVWIGGVEYLGIQEMKLSNLERVERFAKVTGWRKWRVQFRYRGVTLKGL